jgi:hypothetical protein
MLSTRRAAAALATLAVAAAPPTALAATSHHSSSGARKAAEKFCKAQEKKLGRTQFDKQYGKKNALGKCVSRYEKTHKKSK